MTCADKLFRNLWSRYLCHSSSETKWLTALFRISITLLPVIPLIAQLNENCTVAILNRTSQVKPDGTWKIDNIPANFGPVRARATCVQNGITQSGQSNLFTINPNAVTGFSANIVLGAVTPIPTQLAVSVPTSSATQVNQTIQTSVIGTYADGSTKNITAASTGTVYLISNPNLASITADGLITAKASGTVIIQANNEGRQGLTQLSIVLSRDSDGDGIPDDVEIRWGLDPNNPADALDDPDHDGLNNLEEYRAGTDIHNADTDGDTLTDGQEVKTYHTNPLVKDTDGDGVPDNIEVATGSDPNNAASYNLAAALSGIRIAPSSFVIDVNSINGVAYQDLVVTGDFKLGGTIALTAKAKGTSYSSSNLSSCNFGAEDGRVYGSADGSCTITISNSGFTATATGTVRSFTPKALSQIAIPGYANSVDGAGSYAYVAAGITGLQVVSVSDPAHPQIVGALDTPGNANDVRVVGNLAFVADGTSGLQIINISNPAAPTLVGSVDTPGEAIDVMVLGNRAYVADGTTGLAIINITNPANPTLLKQIDTPGTARGVDLLQTSNGSVFAVIADDSPSVGLRVINVTDFTTASIVANLTLQGFPKDLRVAGNYAYVVAYTGGLQIVDLTNPLAPAARGSLPTQIVPRDVEIAGNFAILAEQLFPNAVPLVDISNPASPLLRTTIDFSPLGDYAGTGIAVNGPYIYMTGVSFIASLDKGTTGDTRLFVGQYLPQQDLLGVPPQITLTAPAPNSSVIRGSTVALRATATDDVAVASVTFRVNGTDFFTDTSAPYEALYTVPSNATTLTITASAKDLGNNVGNSQTVTITAIADPLTTVSGRIVRIDSTPVIGATVVCLTGSATSGGNGQFSIANLPTINGDISCTSNFTENGQSLRGSTGTAFTPTLGGITNVGDITIRVGGRILLLSDRDSPATTSIVAALQDAGNDVTVRPPPEYTWDNTNPSLTNFNCMFHLNGATPYNSFPVAAQQALINYVRAGGGYIGFGWSSYEVGVGAALLKDLALHPYTTYLNPGTLTYTKTPGQTGHPVVANLPDSFTVVASDFHETSTTFFTFSETPPIELVSTSGQHAVSVRQLGSGKIVRFSLVDNYSSTTAPAFDPNFLKLFVNAAGWACR